MQGLARERCSVLLHVETRQYRTFALQPWGLQPCSAQPVACSLAACNLTAGSLQPCSLAACSLAAHSLHPCMLQPCIAQPDLVARASDSYVCNVVFEIAPQTFISDRSVPLSAQRSGSGFKTKWFYRSGAAGSLKPLRSRTGLQNHSGFGPEWL